MSTLLRSVSLALVAVAFTLLQAAPSSAHTKSWGSRVELFVADESHLGNPDSRRASGEVFSSNPACKRNRSVVIRKVEEGDDPVVATDTTDADGLYNVAFLDPDPFAEFTATAQSRELRGQHQHICRRGLSEPVHPIGL